MMRQLCNWFGQRQEQQELIGYFLLWYALNVAYNIVNKYALNGIGEWLALALSEQQEEEEDAMSSSGRSLPVTMSCVQFGIGSLYACSLWLVNWRPRPFSSASSARQLPTRPIIILLGQISIHHTLGHMCTLQTLSSNSISFAHVIKAMEPFFSSLLAYAISKRAMNARVYLSLLPVVAGVAMACLGADEFDSKAFAYGMCSNFFFAARGVLSKLLMDHHKNNNKNNNKINSKSKKWTATTTALRDDTLVIISKGSDDDDDDDDNHENLQLKDEQQDEDKEEEQQEETLKLLTLTSVAAAPHQRHSQLLLQQERENDQRYDQQQQRQYKQNNKKLTPNQTSLSPVNLFGVVTCLSFLLSIPIVILFEGHLLLRLWTFYHRSQSNIIHASSPQPPPPPPSLLSTTSSKQSLLTNILSSGLFHYLNNEVMYLTLSNVHPITLAVGNTMKRIFVIIAGVMVFSTPISLQTGIGSIVAISGVFLYSLMKQKYASEKG